MEASIHVHENPPLEEREEFVPDFMLTDEELFFRRYISGFRIGSLCLLAIYSVSSVVLLASLYVDRNASCNPVMRLWTWTAVGTQGVASILRLYLMFAFPSSTAPFEQQREALSALNKLIILKQTLNLFWTGCIVVGFCIIVFIDRCEAHTLITATYWYFIFLGLVLIVVCLWTCAISICIGNSRPIALVAPIDYSVLNRSRGATPDQINSFTSVMVFEPDSVMNEEDRCSICLEKFEKGKEIRLLPCSTSHIFHRPCIDQWLKLSKYCPLCKEDITTATPHEILEEKPLFSSTV